jgi:hypothetical protein
MFISLQQVAASLAKLEGLHPFYGISFLVFKQENLPIGTTSEIEIGRRETAFLDRYYNPQRASKYYYRANRISNPNRHWVLKKKYASSTLQSARTREHTARALIHPKGTNLWGWQPNYVDTLREHLHSMGGLIPAFDLAAWLFRAERFWDGVSSDQILERFLEQFNITSEEGQHLFDLSIPRLSTENLFQQDRVSWEKLQTIIGKPYDAPAEEGGTLSYLELIGVGPSPSIQFSPEQRLNLITGDNGLGKSFLLECAWWALTGEWIDYPALPRSDIEAPSINYQISSKTSRSEIVYAFYDWQKQKWPIPRKKYPTIPGLLIYARVDGSFAVLDPSHYANSSDRTLKLDFLYFDRITVWNGLEREEGSKTRFFSNGLIRDWNTWQANPDRYPFDIFKKVLARLSPDEERPLKPGYPTRIPNDAREIPTLDLPYGEVPIVHLAAGMQRIVSLAYLIVWTWQEHQTQSKLAMREPQRRMVILIDEVEAHLHPRWQRLIIPSLLQLGKDLNTEIDIQFLISTHSPLVMTSIEPVFDTSSDKLFHLDMIENDDISGEVKLEEMDFVRLGPVDAWLTSDFFQLDFARSREAGEALNDALKLQEEETPNPASIQAVSKRLLKLLAADDEFWPRWIGFAAKHGIHL